LLTEVLTNSHIPGQRFSNLAASEKAPLTRAAGFQKVLGSPSCQAESDSQLLAYIFFIIAKSVSVIIALGTGYFFESRGADLSVLQTAWADAGAARMGGGTVPSPWRSCLCGADRSATAADSAKYPLGAWGGVCWMR